MDRNENPSLGETNVLLRRFHDGDGAALESLLARHLPFIRAVVEKRLTPALRARADAEDLVQDAVVQVLKFGPRFVVSDDIHFRALLARIVENVLHDKYDWFNAARRKMARERPIANDTVLNLDPPASSSLTTASQAFDRRERQALVRLALELLSPDDREMLILRQWENLQFPEIAEQLGIAEDAARMRFNRAFARLAGHVSEIRRERAGQPPSNSRFGES